jgi:hypothetical protein
MNSALGLTGLVGPIGVIQPNGFFGLIEDRLGEGLLRVHSGNLPDSSRSKEDEAVAEASAERLHCLGRNGVAGQIQELQPGQVWGGGQGDGALAGARAYRN